jgi:hypothetical protein
MTNWRESSKPLADRTEASFGAMPGGLSHRRVLGDNNGAFVSMTQKAVVPAKLLCFHIVGGFESPWLRNIRPGALRTLTLKDPADVSFAVQDSNNVHGVCLKGVRRDVVQPLETPKHC